jgi:hypothetical protein
MSYFFKFIWNDALAYLSATAAFVGVIFAIMPQLVPEMPDSYGYWIAIPSGAVLGYRIGKGALLLTFGIHVDADVREKYVGFRDVAKTHYSLDTKTGKVIANWQSFDQQGQLRVAYWNSYPNFHIAYWSCNYAENS